MTTYRYKVEPTPDAIDPLTGKPTGEHDVLMLEYGVWEWAGTYESRRAAQAAIRAFKATPFRQAFEQGGYYGVDAPDAFDPSVS